MVMWTTVFQLSQGLLNLLTYLFCLHTGLELDLPCIDSGIGEKRHELIHLVFDGN